MKTIENIDNVKCTGCFSCLNICPVNAISFKLDKEGFFYPIINSKICKKCGLCYQYCPVINQKYKEKDNKKIYFGWIKNKKIQRLSSSGGYFSALSTVLLNNGGVIYGVTFENKYAKHVRIIKEENLKKIRGSKYLQSVVSDSLTKVMIDLKKGKEVIYSGTPCQIAGLYNYLKQKKIKTKNLITIQIICHGLPSYRVFKDYLRTIGIKDIYNINFRDKTFGWFPFSSRIKAKRKSYFCIFIKDLFMNGYMKNFFLRKSCYRCKYQGNKFIADIALGDFWGANYEQWNEKGVSLIFINSEKADNLFEKCKYLINFKKICYADAIKGNPRISSGNYSSEQILMREKFFEDYKQGFDFVKKKYLKNSTYFIINYIIKKLYIRIARKLKKGIQYYIKIFRKSYS